MSDGPKITDEYIRETVANSPMMVYDPTVCEWKAPSVPETPRQCCMNCKRGEVSRYHVKCFVPLPFWFRREHPEFVTWAYTDFDEGDLCEAFVSRSE